MKLYPYKPGGALTTHTPRWKLLLLHRIGMVLGIHFNYHMRFIPITGKRADLRGRRVGESHVDPHKAMGAFAGVQTAPKEKTDGIYLLLAEASLDGFYHPGAAAVTDGRSGSLYAGLPDAPEGGPAAAVAAQAAADDAAGVAGVGEVGGRADRPQAAAESSRSVGEMTGLTASQIGLINRPRSLDTLGER